MQFYMIYNDTSLIINVKQCNTEETCAIQPGSSLAYSWRSHKRHQLLQLYVPKYKLTSQPFQINHNGIEEIRLVVDPSRGTHISFLVQVETRLDQHSNAYLPFVNRCVEHASLSFKKFVLVQAKLCVVNMLNLEIANFSLVYSSSSSSNLEESSAVSNVEVHVSSVPKYSRSTYTHELVESPGKLVEISSLKINDSTLPAANKKQQDFLNKLINGVSVYDAKQGVKYWLNLYENKLGDDTTTATQICLVLTPVLVFCSYMPYELDIRINNHVKMFRVRSNSISYCSSSDFDPSKIGIWFDRLSRASLSEDESDDLYEVIVLLKY